MLNFRNWKYCTRTYGIIWVVRKSPIHHYMFHRTEMNLKTWKL